MHFNVDSERFFAVMQNIGRSSRGRLYPMERMLRAEIGERLALIRHEVGLSQKDVAKELDVSWRAYQTCEVGQRAISSKMLVDFCARFNVRPFWIMMGEEPIYNVDSIGTAGEIVELMLEELKVRNMELSPSKFRSILEKLTRRKASNGELPRSEIIDFIEIAGG